SAANVPTPASEIFVDAAAMALTMPVRPLASDAGNAASRLAVPARYASVMSAPETSRARGRFRRGSRISSPRHDAVSMPPNANAIVERKRASFRPIDGTRLFSVNAVADPNFRNAIDAQPIRSSAGIHVAIAVALWNRRPHSRPRTFIAVATASAASENP